MIRPYCQTAHYEMLQIILTPTLFMMNEHTGCPNSMYMDVKLKYYHIFSASDYSLGAHNINILIYCFHLLLFLSFPSMSALMGQPV